MDQNDGQRYPWAITMHVSCNMKGATDLLYTKATYNKKREGLGSPRWHFTTYPSVLLTEIFSEKIAILFHWNYETVNFLDASLHIYKMVCPFVGPSKNKENRCFRPPNVRGALLGSQDTAQKWSIFFGTYYLGNKYVAKLKISSLMVCKSTIKSTCFRLFVFFFIHPKKIYNYFFFRFVYSFFFFFACSPLAFFLKRGKNHRKKNCAISSRKTCSLHN